MIGFRVLGCVSLTGEGGPLSGKSSQPRRIALLALLVCHPYHTLAREKLLAYLWPESDEESGRHRLSESLYVLRKSLGEGVLISEGDQVRLDPQGVECDLLEFRKALAEGNHEAAVALHSGPFLDGFFLKEADEFHRWLESERQAISGEYALALETLAGNAVADGDALQAVNWWSRLAANDPYNSRHALGLMRALAAAGDPGNAIHHAWEHTRLLQEELGAEATPELLAFAESLRRGEVPEVVSERGVPGVSPGEGQGTPPDGGRPRVTPREGPGIPSEAPAVPPEPGSRAVNGSPEPVPIEAPSERGSGSRRRAWFPAAVLSIALLGVGAAAYSLTRDRPPGRIPNLVVVPAFENHTGDPELDEVGVLAAFWVEEAIQQVEGVQLFPSSLLGHIPLQETDSVPGGGIEEPAHAGDASWESANAGWAVRGAIRPSGDALEFRVEVIDLTHPQREQQVVEVGVRDSLSGILDRLARRVSGAVSYEFDPYMESIDGRDQPLPSPPTIEAFREHRLGYQAYDRRDAAASFHHHLAAYALDTTLVRAVVAAAYMAPSRQGKDSLAQLAMERRHLLTRRGQLDLDLLTANLAGDREAALEAIRGLARMEPGGFSSLLEARSAMGLNLPGEGMKATERYDPNPDWRRGEADRYWLYRAEALHMLDRYEDELAEARTGRERYPTHTGLLREEIRALAALGRADEVSELLLEGRSLPGIRESEAVVAGMELRAHGYPDAARRVFNQTADWLRGSLVEGRRNGRVRLDLARALYGAERWSEALEVAMGLLVEEPGDPEILGLVGCAAARMGDTLQAETSMGHLSSVNRPEGPRELHYQMATIAAVLGRPDEAMRLLNQAYSEGLRHGLQLHMEMNFESLREREDFIALVTPKG